MSLVGPCSPPSQPITPALQAGPHAACALPHSLAPCKALPLCGCRMCNRLAASVANVLLKPREMSLSPSSKSQPKGSWSTAGNVVSTRFLFIVMGLVSLAFKIHLQSLHVAGLGITNS